MPEPGLSRRASGTQVAKRHEIYLEEPMDSLSLQSLAGYWSAPAVAANIVIFLNLIGALVLGLVVGYERAYHGRAAGMRTYGLVCMASAAVTVIFGSPGLWYGGHTVMTTTPDPAHVFQGILTGIGFLGAGVILREGLSIRGLTTAASIWSSSAIGVLVGVGFYAAAILLTALSAVCMVWVSKLEHWLPSHSGVAIVVRFKRNFHPREEVLRRVAKERGYEIAAGSLSITFEGGQPEWHYVAVTSAGRKKGPSVSELAGVMSSYEGVESFQLAHCRH
jgi:putative Mg2+ transporter-C (MgtC) family protein